MRKPLLFLLIALILLLCFFWIYFPAISRYRELKIQEEKITRDISDLDQRIEGLLEERKLLQTDLNYLEKVIREELGLVKPGEIIYKMIPESIRKLQEEETSQMTEMPLAQPVSSAETPAHPTAATGGKPEVVVPAVPATPPAKA